MRWVELRRHSFTKKGDGRGRGSDLSPEGVRAARAEGERLDAVAYVGVSVAQRTMETAIAMGFAVDDVLDLDSAQSSGEVAFHEWWDWPHPWAEYRHRMATRPPLRSFAERQAGIVLGSVGRVSDLETALLVGHGGWIEPTVIAALGDDDPGDLGPSFNHLEGVRLAFDGQRFELDAVRRRG